MTRQRDYIWLTPLSRLGPTVAHIKATVADYYAINAVELIGDRRGREVARPRQIAMYLASKLTSQSTPAIGRHLGGRDHTTVMHGIRNIKRLRETDPEIAQDIEALTHRLSA